MAENQDEEGLRHVESKEDLFEDAADDIDSQGTHFSETDNEGGGGGGDDDGGAEVSSDDRIRELLEEARRDKERIAAEAKEEREALGKEVAILKSRLSALVSDRGQESSVSEEVSDAPVQEVLDHCLQLVGAVAEERARSDSRVRELQQQVEDLTLRVQVQQDVEVVADRMLASLRTVVSQNDELSDYSVMGKISYVESGASMLMDQYNWFLYETDQLWRCLSEGGFKVEMQEGFGTGSIFNIARAELMDMKNREMQMGAKLEQLETENRRLVEEVEKGKAMTETVNTELGKVKEELRQEKIRYANTKEKLSMAVTKGKALVQQRDSLKQALAEKTSELEKSSAELHEKSGAADSAESSKMELVKCETLIVSLQNILMERNSYLESIHEVLSRATVLEEIQATDAVDKVKWLVDSVVSYREANLQKEVMLQDLEETFSRVDISEEHKSSDITDRLKWLVNMVASLQELLSQRDKMSEELDDIFSMIDVPPEFQSMDTMGRIRWLVEERNQRQDDLLEFHKLKDALSLVDLPEIASSDLEARIYWLKDSVNNTKAEINLLQDEILRTKEATCNEIDRLSASLLAESQEKEFMRSEMDSLMHRYEEITETARQSSSEKDQIIRMLLDVSGMSADIQNSSFTDMAELISRCLAKLKEEASASIDSSPSDFKSFERLQSLFYVRDQELTLCLQLLEEDMLFRSEVSHISNSLRVASQELGELQVKSGSLEKDLARSEEKSAVLKEKLSLAVKKGKGLFQDRENLKLLLDEKNTEIEKLKHELQQLESVVAESRDQLSTLSVDSDKVLKLEADHIAIKDQRDQLEQFLLESNNMLQRVIASLERIDSPSDTVFDDPVDKANWLADYIKQCEQAKTEADSELEKAKDKIKDLGSKLAEADNNMKQLEDELSASRRHITEVEEERDKVRDASRNAKEELEKAMEKARVQAEELSNATAARESIEDALTLAENNVSSLTKELEEYRVMHANAATDLEKLTKEFATQSSSLMEALQTMESLKSALSQAEASISLLTFQNNDMMIARTDLDNELAKLKAEAEFQSIKLSEASETIISLQEALVKAKSDISVFEDEKRIVEQEVSSLRSKLDTSMEDLTGTHGGIENRSVELVHQFGDLELLLKNEDLITTFRKCYVKEFENLKNMDLVLKDINGRIIGKALELVQDHPLKDEEGLEVKNFPQDHLNNLNAEMINGEITGVDNISLYFKKAVDTFQSRNKLLAESFEGFHAFTDGFAEDLLLRFRSTRDMLVILVEHMESMEGRIKNMDMHTQEQNKTIASLENNIKTLESACIDATRELHFEVENNVAGLKSIPELQKLNESLIPVLSEVIRGNSVEGHVKVADALLLATRKAQSLIKLFESTSNEAAKVVVDLQWKLKESEEISKKAIEERDLLKQRVSELETNVLLLQSSCKELKLQGSEYQAVADELRRKLNESEGTYEMAIEERDALQQRLSQLMADFQLLQSVCEDHKLKVSEYQVLEDKLQRKLKELEDTTEDIIEERDALLLRVSELEADVEVSQSSCEELKLKVSEYQAVEEKLKTKEAEHFTLQMKEKEIGETLISARELEALFDKIRAVEISFADLGDAQIFSSVDAKKLFWIVDSVTQLQHNTEALADDRNNLLSALTEKDLLIEHLNAETGQLVRTNEEFGRTKSELSEIVLGVQRICDMLGSNGIIMDHKSAGVQMLLSVTEKQILALLGEVEHLKSRNQDLNNELLGCQKVVNDLSAKVKFLEGSLPSRVAQPEVLQERGIFEAPSKPSGSEISEMDDVGLVAKSTISSGPSAAAHARTMRKGSSDHLALNIDLESDTLINNEETEEAKGHVFKSLNTSGLVPRQGKALADRVDGLWVSGGRVLMSRPRARLGLIAYWLVLHLWLLGTIL